MSAEYTNQAVENKEAKVAIMTSGGSGGSSLQLNVPQLKGANYRSWREMIEMALELRGLAGVLKGVAIEERKNLEARFMILESLDEAHRGRVRGMKSAAEIMARLQLIYADDSASNVYRLLIEYYRYEKRPEDSMGEHIGRVDQMRQSLEDLGQKQSEAVYHATLIGSLPQEYSDIMPIWEFTHEDLRTTSKLVSILLKREEDLKKKNSAVQAFVAHQTKPKSIAERKKSELYAICKELGHWYRECPKKSQEAIQKSSERDKSKRKETVMNVVTEDRDEVCFTIRTNTDELKSKWVSDSGASSHMCNNLNWFGKVRLYDTPKLCQVGNGMKLEIKGIGFVRVASKLGSETCSVTLDDVLWVPGLSTNLLSVGASAERGLETSYSKNRCFMKLDGKVVATGVKMADGIYTMDFKLLAKEPMALTVR